MDREKFRQQIEDSPLNRDLTSFLLARLKVASHEGCAAVVRDFEEAMIAYRRKVLPSHRRYFQGRMPDPMNKQMISFEVK
jgi:hypothetical protein